MCTSAQQTVQETFTEHPPCDRYVSMSWNLMTTSYSPKSVFVLSWTHSQTMFPSFPCSQLQSLHSSQWLQLGVFQATCMLGHKALLHILFCSLLSSIRWGKTKQNPSKQEQSPSRLFVKHPFPLLLSPRRLFRHLFSLILPPHEILILWTYCISVNILCLFRRPQTIVISKIFHPHPPKNNFHHVENAYLRGS